jgi:hypothetical protein
MTMALSLIVATLGIATAIGHSMIGESKILRPLYAQNQSAILKAPAMRAVIRAVWHTPSFTWAVLGLAVLVAHIQGGNRLLSIVAALIFAVSGAGNLISLRRLHFGGLMLVAAAAFTIADWHYAL